MSDQIKIRLISQLIKGISRVVQKLLKYFNGTIIPTFFVPLSPVAPVKCKQSTAISSMKISDTASISQSWFISIVLP